MPKRTLRAQLRENLDRREIRGADNKYREYIRPLGARGMHIVKIPCNDEQRIVSGPRETFAPGTVLLTGSNRGTPGEVILNFPPPGHRGGSEFRQLFPTPGVLDVLGLTSANPATLYNGTTDNPVTLTGYGFLASPLDTFSAVVFNSSTGVYDPDPFVTIHDVVWVSATVVTVEIDVAAGAGSGYRINILPERA